MKNAKAHCILRVQTKGCQSKGEDFFFFNPLPVDKRCQSKGEDFFFFNPLPDKSILGFSSSAANTNMMAEI